MNHQNIVAVFSGLGLLIQSVSGADTQPPTVTITRPANGTTVTGPLTIAASATDNVGVSSVTFKVDGATVATPVTTSPYNLSVDTTKFANGVHTLLAEVSDAAGNAARSAWVQITVTNRLRYDLGQGPFTVEDLGSVISVNTQEKQIMFRLATNNDLHLLLYYDVTSYGTYPLQILDANLTQGTARLTDGILGRPGANGTALHPNGKVYLGSSDPGYLLEYDPATGATNLIGKLHPTKRRDAQILEIGDDGWVYIGEYNSTGGGAVGRYNPTKSIFEDLGIMDTNFVGYQYSYTIGADTRYVYVGLGQMPWYLAIYDTQTTNRTVYWKADTDVDGEVCHGKAGGWYYRRRTPSATIWYRLENGQPFEIAATNVPPHYTIWQDTGNVVHSRGQFPTIFNTEVNLDNAYPDSGANHAVIRWRTVGATNWQSVDVSGFRLQSINSKRLYPWDSNRLLGSADFYGPLFLYDLQTKNTTTLGRPQYSIYDAIFEQGGVYLSGYTAATLAYDPARPWTLSGSTTNQASPTVNPHKVAAAFGKYHFYTTFGADGLIYIGAYHIRDSTGGELGWYDRLTGNSGSLRDPFLNDGVRDLKSALGGTKLVYSSDNEKLFIFDVSSKQIERTIIPNPGIGSLDKVLEVAPGIIFGATGNRVFKVDIRDGSILYNNTLPGEANGLLPSYDRRLVVGPDGYVWLFIENSLYRINPADSVLTKLIDTPAKSLLFKDGDLYLYGGPNLYRIRGILIPTSPAAPTSLHAIGPTGK